MWNCSPVDFGKMLRATARARDQGILAILEPGLERGRLYIFQAGSNMLHAYCTQPWNLAILGQSMTSCALVL
jgi:hypothetical protein